MKLLLAALVLSLTACASTGDIDKLQTQIDGLQVSVKQAPLDAQSALLASVEASGRAALAEAAANRAAQYAQDTNSKLDNLFKKSMTKQNIPHSLSQKRKSVVARIPELAQQYRRILQDGTFIMSSCINRIKTNKSVMCDIVLLYGITGGCKRFEYGK